MEVTLPILVRQMFDEDQAETPAAASSKANSGDSGRGDSGSGDSGSGDSGSGTQRKTYFRLRPLLVPLPEVQDKRLSRGMEMLERELLDTFRSLLEQERHDAVASLAWNPTCDEQILDLEPKSQRGDVRGRYHLIQTSLFGRRMACMTSLPDLWFEVPAGTSLEARATTALNAWLRKQEREEGDVNLSDLSVSKHTWILPLTFELPDVRPPKPKEGPSFAFLGGDRPMNGREELAKVARNLNRLSDEELDEALLRDREVGELERLLLMPERRPILLVGPPGVGKTTLVHTLLRRKRRQAPGVPQVGDVYLISPQRLIAGMTYVGQWEERLLAILKEMKRKDHVFYADELLGLFQAGRSAGSDLTVGAVLQPWLERREVRFIGEITPEALRLLREQARGLVELCHVIPLQPNTEAETLRILLHLMRRLETEQRVRLEPAILPYILTATERYEPSSALPGRATRFLNTLITRNSGRGRPISLSDAQQALNARTGLLEQWTHLDLSIQREGIRAELQKMVVGQSMAIDVMADLLSLYRSRLQQPGRPVANLLFLGPTGVGKTESAKALAKTLFGEEGANEALLRFDLNEFAGGNAVSRLVGTVYQPEGLLTSAIRRRPFAVVLLDEIEKAHPSVFSLLLQVLGEGRLTDALGRTVDFTNAIIVMTSNLGVKEAARSLGFGSMEAAAAARQAQQTFVKAAESFFSPEFFNRIDRVIPFAPLTREELRRIATLEVDHLRTREGLIRRRVCLRVDPMALDWLAEQGYHPTLGARALKRVVERELARPVAERVSTFQTRRPILVRVFRGPKGLLIDAHVMEPAEKAAWPQLPKEARELSRQLLKAARALKDMLDAKRPRTGPGPDKSRIGFSFSSADVGQEEIEAWSEAAELKRKLSASIEFLEDHLEAYEPVDGFPVRVRHVNPRSYRNTPSDKGFGPSLDEICAAEDMYTALVDFFGDREDPTEKWKPWDEAPLNLTDVCALLSDAAEEIEPSVPFTATEVLLLGHDEKPAARKSARPGLLDMLPRGDGVTTGQINLRTGKALNFDWRSHEACPEEDRSDWSFLCRGAHAMADARAIIGLHLEVQPTWLGLYEFQPIILAEGESLSAAFLRHQATLQSWREALMRGETRLEDHPCPPGRLQTIRIDSNLQALAELEPLEVIDSGGRLVENVRFRRPLSKLLVSLLQPSLLQPGSEPNGKDPSWP